MIWFLLITALHSIVYLYFIKPLQYWKNQQVPQYSLAKILKDMLRCVFSTEPLVEMTKRIYDDFPNERYIGVYQFSAPSLQLRDPELLRQITIKDFDHFTDHFGFMTEKTEPIFARSVLGLKGDKWKNMRMTLTPSFTATKLKRIFPLVTVCVRELTSFLENNPNSSTGIDVEDILKKFSCDVITTCAFGNTSNSFKDPNNDFFITSTKLFKTSPVLNLKMMFKIFFPTLANFFNVQIIDGKVQKFFENTIINNIKTREMNRIVREDMIYLLMEAKRKIEKEEIEVEEDKDDIHKIIRDDEKNVKRTTLTDKDIAAQAFVFFLAGFEAVSTIISFLLHELAVNPDIQENLYKEVKENAYKFGENPSFESLMNMKYLDMVVSEILRKAPILALGERVCTKPYTIPAKKVNERPIHLKVGQLIFFTPYAMHHDPKYFPNPERFDPERFSNENKSKIISGTYLPFGIGPRHCIGNRFALMEIKFAIYFILFKFKIVVVEKTAIPLKLGKSQLNVTIEGGVWVGFQKRT